MNDSPVRLAAALADRYRIDRELGQGGMATVYLAHDLRHEREVAIKVLREDLSASLGSGRFLREIKIAAQLQHPHILPLLDSGEADGFLFFVMPYIKGQSLRERLAREGELPVHEAVRLLTEVVDALVEAHEHGVVHRDIKPDNVMLSGRHALVTDFGVAKAISEATGRNTVTTLGVAVGTPTYMSPEQAAADPHVDHRSDIYSVGVMAYEMLSGRPPFTGSTPQQVLAAHVTEAPDPVSKRRPAISPALEAVVMKCLAKRPADRYQTAAELHAVLEALATPSTGITPTQTRPIAAVTGVRRRAVALAAGIVVIAALIFAATRGHGGSAFTAVSPIMMQVTSSGDVGAPSISPDGTRIAYSTKHCDVAGRCLYDLVVQDLGGAGTLTVASGATAIYGEIWSPDGRFLLMSGSFALQWGDYLVPATVQGPAQSVGCCNGQWLATSDTILLKPLVPPGDTVGWMRVVTTADRRVRDSIRIDRPGASFGAAPSPDGKRIAVTIYPRGHPPVLRLLGRDGRVVDSLRSPPGEVRWTPDGSGLLFTAFVAASDGAFDLLYHAVGASGRISPRTDTIWQRSPMESGDFSVSRDGAILAFAQGPRQFTVVSLTRPDLASSRYVARPIAASTTPMGGYLSPDGREIALYRRRAATGDRMRAQLSLMPADSGAEVVASPPMDTLIGWSWPRGKSSGLVFWSPQVKGVDRVDLFDLASGRAQALATLPDSNASLSTVAELPDGRWLTSERGARDLEVRSASGAIERRIHFPDALSYFLSIAVAPAGDVVAISGYDTGTEDSAVVYRIRLADGTAKELAAVLSEQPGEALQWLDNGDFVLVIGETYETQALYRVTPAGDVRRVGVLPYGSGSYTIARDGLHMVVSLAVPHADVWLVKNFAKMLPK